jgi:hypothetical protein
MYGVDKRVEVRAAFAAGKKIKQIVKELEGNWCEHLT